MPRQRSGLAVYKGALPQSMVWTALHRCLIKDRTVGKYLSIAREQRELADDVSSATLLRLCRSRTLSATRGTAPPKQSDLKTVRNGPAVTNSLTINGNLFMFRWCSSFRPSACANLRGDWLSQVTVWSVVNPD